MLELLPAGICGVMPGFGVADLRARAYRLVEARRMQQAYDVLQGVLPQIVFSLQNMELYHHAEKRLPAARGIMNALFANCGQACMYSTRNTLSS